MVVMVVIFFMSWMMVVMVMMVIMVVVMMMITVMMLEVLVEKDMLGHLDTFVEIKVITLDCLHKGTSTDRRRTLHH
jgi:hypothetical protein